MYVEQIKTPRTDVKHGVDYGSEGRALVIMGELSLVWQPGGTYWSGWAGNRYSPATLGIRGLNRIALVIHSGGRLSKAVIAGATDAIDSHFGEGTAAKIHTRKTLVLQPNTCIDLKGGK